jgi:hypothetical protein
MTNEQQRVLVGLDDGIWFVAGYNEYTATMDDELSYPKDMSTISDVSNVVFVASPVSARKTLFFTATAIVRAGDVDMFSEIPCVAKIPIGDFDHVVISLDNDVTEDIADSDEDN